MEMLLKRRWLTDKSSIGVLYIAEQWQCLMLEPPTRPAGEKVFGHTAIPLGRYLVSIERSPHLSELAGHDVFTPRLHNVPGYEGVLIHPGNFPKDTLACLVTGNERGQDCVFESRVAYEALLAKLKAAQGPIHITVTVDPGGLPIA